ncbi:sugar diacid recognition domain-containing protein [Caproiciproducens sp. CPB-2]|uniref:sugar diacid recognition domain-containing protein n=1 Tax=unclassified Caproiciproducens TaxID=2643836 RepID=UPI0023DC3BC8|nr:sugar diacid recognition domain-containing protein [Caproiciproducens sp. CPB-2]MDF1496415.1 sugar diacid recognition domain-containing protein [Caproiciproducens sp. CPB-2]
MKNVNFMGEGGVIITTMQPARRGQVHEGARRIMSGEIDELAIGMEDAKKLQGTLLGYNRVVACISKANRLYRPVRIPEKNASVSASGNYHC